MADKTDILTPESTLLFNKLERDMQVKIPAHLKHLLELSGYTNLFALADFNADDISILEATARRYYNNPNYVHIYDPLDNVYKKNYVIRLPYEKLLIAIDPKKKNAVQPNPCSGKADPLKKVTQLKGDYSHLISQAFLNISKGSATKQLIVGSLTGWTTGFLTMKVGRTAAFAVGGSILIFQIAQHKGYVKMDWDKVKQKVDQTSKQLNTKYHYVEKSPKWRANITKFARSNTCFAAGFVGGFLIGMAS